MMASSPLFRPRTSSPSTDNLLSWLSPWVVKGSEKDDEGGERKGGGKGRGSFGTQSVASLESKGDFGWNEGYRERSGDAVGGNTAAWYGRAVLGCRRTGSLDRGLIYAYVRGSTAIMGGPHDDDNDDNDDNECDTAAALVTILTGLCAPRWA